MMVSHNCSRFISTDVCSNECADPIPFLREPTQCADLALGFTPLNVDPLGRQAVQLFLNSRESLLPKKSRGMTDSVPLQDNK